MSNTSTPKSAAASSTVITASPGATPDAVAAEVARTMSDAFPPGATDVEGGLRLTIQRRDEEIAELRDDLRRAESNGPDRALRCVTDSLRLSALADAYRVSGDVLVTPADRARRQRLFDAVMAGAQALIG